VGGSFRDPAGHLYRGDGYLYRTVSSWFEPDLQAFLDSGLYAELVAERLLVEHEELDPASAPEPCARYLQVPALPFITYPWEWSSRHLRAAAQLTLELQLRALERGLTLRDASAFNVQFRGHQPIFIDTLSFASSSGDQPWPAYGQFCQHFLAPLALRSLVDPRLGDLQQLHLDGIPLDLASRLLPRRTKASPGLGLHLHAHSRSATRAALRGTHRTIKTRPLALRAVTEQLLRTVTSLNPPVLESPWSDYEASLEHYEVDALELKRSTVRRWAELLKPERAVDLGSNRSSFGRILAQQGCEVLAVDSDHATVEFASRDLAEDPPSTGSVLPIRADLLSPTPDLGWGGVERDSLARRTDVDLVLALALIHHVVLTGGIPLDRAVEGLALYGRRLVIEWVPPEDPKARQLAAGRTEDVRGYDKRAFLEAVSTIGRIVETVSLQVGGRELLLVEMPQ
jgi:hypothetical protein